MATTVPIPASNIGVDYSEEAGTIMSILMSNCRDFTEYNFYSLARVFGIPHERISLLCRATFHKFKKEGRIAGTKRSRLCGKSRDVFQVWEVIDKAA
jgi:hypothetical protein